MAEVLEEKKDEAAVQVTPDAAGFDIGFNKTAGQPAGEVKAEVKAVEAKETPVEEAPKAEGPPVVAAPDPWAAFPAEVRQTLEALPNRLRNIEGHIGGLTSAMKASREAAQAATKAGADAPTQAQVQAATASGEKWKQIKEDFPEWAEAMEERLAAQAATSAPAAPAVDVEGLKKEWAESTQAQVAEAIDQAEERALVRFKHPNWRATVNTPEYLGWVKVQTPALQALEQSAKADDAIKLLDLYEVHKVAAAKKAAEDLKNKTRLESNITPKGAGAPVQTTISGEDAFNSGFKKVTKRA